MKRLDQTKKTYIKWGLGIIFLLLLIYFPIFFLGYKMSFTNFMYTVLPWKSEEVSVLGPNLSDVADRFIPGYFSTLKEGFISLWNSHLSIGSPGDIWLYMYPVNYLYLLPESLAMFLNSVLQFSLGFVGMYFFLKENNLHKLACVMGGLSYTFASALVLWHGWPHSDVAFWAPFLFLLYEKALRQNKVKYWIFMSIVMYFMLVCGMPTYAAYFFYLLGFYVLIRTILLYKKDVRKILAIFIPFALAVIAAAIASLPYTIELLGTVSANGYNASRKGMAGLALSFEYLRNTLFPLIRGDFSINANESTFYNGVLCMLTFPLIFFRFKQKKTAHFWTGAFIIVFLIVYTHVFDFIYKLMPAINTSIKFRNLVLLNFIIAILFAVNLTDLFEHISDFYADQKIRLILAGVFTFELIGYIVLAVYMRTQLITAKNQYDYYKAIILFALSISALIIYLCILPVLKKHQKVQHFMPAVLLVILMIDLGLFAEEYIPYIERDASTLPASTDTIQYLQDNTEDMSRYTAIGNWTLFPQTNMYYGIYDIRSHSLMTNTNADLKEYFTQMYPQAYEGTGTRLAIKNLQDIANYNLLKYLGCKYIVYDAAKDYEGVSVSGFPVSPIGDIYGNNIVTQRFTASQDNLDWVSVFVATYGKTITTSESFHFELFDVASGKMVAELVTPLSEIADDSYLELSFPLIKDSAGKTYEIRLYGDNQTETDAITAWTYGAEVYDGKLNYANETLTGNDLVIRKHYMANEVLSRVHVGTDGLTTLALDESSERITLVEHVTTGTEATLLKEMSSSYDAHAMFLSEDYDNKMKQDVPLTEDDECTITEYENDRVTIDASVSAPRYLILNDYYNKNWSVYVDGVKKPLVKANYLMRGVYIDTAGKHTVEFVYEPQLLYTLFILSGITFLLLVLLALLHKPIDRLLKKAEKAPFVA